MNPPTVTAYIGMGANLGDARATLRAAAQALASLPGVEAVRGSPLFRSAPVDAAGPDFLNAVLCVDCRLTPQGLLAAMQAIEAAHGRERPYPNAPRTLDLDLLLHGTTVLNTPALQLPHPRMHLRAFVLLPLLALAPALEAPGLGRLASYLGAAGDQAVVPMDDLLLP